MPNSTNKAEEYMENRFGITTEKINLEKINGDYWLCSEEKTRLQTETRGIRAVRNMEIGLKPTTYFLQLLQDEIKRNMIEVSEDDLKAFNQGKMIQRQNEEKGYIAMKMNERLIGCGFYMNGLVSSRIPKGRLEELVKSI